MNYYFNGIPVFCPLKYEGKSFGDGLFWYKVFKDETFFQREKTMLEAVAKARCPGVVKIHETGILKAVHDDGSSTTYHAIKEEFIDGETFMEYTETHHDEEAGLNVFIHLAEICQRLEMAHIMHNDIKPQNVIIREGGEPVLIDFGISKLEDEPVLDIHTNISVGFSAKEKSSKAITYRSDICSFGYLMQYYMDRNPDGGAAARGQNYSKGFNKIMVICSKENPQDRYSTFSEVTQALEKLRESNRQSERGEKKKAQTWKMIPAIRRGASRHIRFIVILLYMLSGYIMGLGIYMRCRPVDKEPLRSQATDPSILKDSSLLLTDIINHFKNDYDTQHRRRDMESHHR